MHRILLLLLVFLSFSPLYPLAAEEIQAGFIRDDDLWVLIGNKEKQVTQSKNVISQPKWSADGKWLLYQLEAPSEFQKNERQAEIWAYHIETEEKKKIFYDGHSPTWSPTKNVIAFNSSGILNVSDFNQFYNVATGVDSYTWLPDGSGFLLSSQGVLKPDGWTSASLYTKKINDYYNVILFGGVDLFFQLPKEIGLNNNKISPINTSNFEFSPSNKWIAFIASPTASLSMDSNMLCLISSDGENFEVIDEVIFGVGKPKWAPSSDSLAFIAGGGRIVFGFKDKDLKIREMPVSGSFTPESYAELDFDWVTNNTIVSSRLKEKEWSNNFAEHPLPCLYHINVETSKQEKISSPPKGYGDYHPQYVKPIEKLVWLRGTSITDKNQSLWMANSDGTNAKKWLDNVDMIEFYEYKNN